MRSLFTDQYRRNRTSGTLLLIVGAVFALVALAGCATTGRGNDPTDKTGTEIDKTILHLNGAAKLNEQVAPHADLIGKELLTAQMRDLVDGKGTAVNAGIELANVRVLNSSLRREARMHKNAVADMKKSARWRYGGWVQTALWFIAGYLVWITFTPIIATLLSAWWPGLTSVARLVARFSQRTNVFRIGNGIAKVLPGEAV